MNNVVSILLFLLTSLSFLGCESQISSSSVEKKDVTLSGYVIDGRISGANVCYDANLNGLCDSNEEITITNKDGFFSFGTYSLPINTVISYMAQNGIDTATGKNFIGTFRYAQPIGTQSTTYITPLTDMAAKYFFDHENQNLDGAENSNIVAAKAYNLPNHLLKSPHGYGGVFVRSQEIQQIKSMFEKLVIKTIGELPSFSQRVVLREKIKSAMLLSILDNDYSFNAVDALNYLEESTNLEFNNNEKVFISEQLANIKYALEYYNQYDLNTSDPRFNTYQKMLEEQADIAYNIINNSDENSTMTPFELSIDVYAEDTNNTDNNTTDTNTTNTTNFSGKVVDGYMQGATVCIDLEYDGVCNLSDPYAKTDTNGTFSFTDLNISKDTIYPIISSGGIDSFTQNSYVGQLKGLIVSNDINNTSSTVISPLTDLLAYDFLIQNTQDESTYSSSVTKIASALEVSEVELLSDVAQDKSLFVKSLFLEQIKYAVEKTILNNGYSDNEKIRKEVSRAIYERISNTGYTNLLVEQIISNVVINLPIISIDTEDKTFFTDSLSELKTLLKNADDSSSVLTYTLPTLQRAVEDKIQTLYSDFTTSDLNLSVEDIVYSDFDTATASHDEMACKLGGVYINQIKDINTTVDVPAVDSDYGIQVDASKEGDVVVYYPINKSILENDFTTIWDDESQFNFFAFDKSWVNNENNQVYIKTPKNNDGKYGCYKVILDSDKSGEIELEKVFRYSF